ncbi:MAG: S9 family peptidase [Deltaproteobacteria bacterium]|nr:S9 family peptidase [Deltaproteobacteria bacterium]
MQCRVTTFAVAAALLLVITGAWGGEVTITPLTITSEGAPVQAILYQPREVTGRLPALVLSPGRGRDIKGLEWLSRALAERGYIVLAQRYRDGDIRYYLRDADDIRHAISHLQGLPNVDPGRVGIIGHSRGGMASLLAAAKDPRVRSTVALSAPTDHVRYVRGLREYAPSRYGEMVKSRGGTPDEVPEYYREISAVNHASQIKTPVLLIHGTLDLVAPHDHSQWMYDALVKTGNPRVKLEMLPRLGHFFEDTYRPHQFGKVVELASRWFAETLK